MAYLFLKRKSATRKAAWTRNSVALFVFIVIVLIPSLFVALPAFQAIAQGTPLVQAFTSSGVWSTYWQSLFLSYGLAVIVTILGIIIGIPMAILIARKTFGKWPSTILDTLLNIPIIVPSIALGLSLKFFWQGAGIPEFLLLVFAHLAITFPYFVRSMSAAMDRISLDMEEAAKTLGAKPFTVFKSIVLPLTKYSILSGAIIVFTRSISETGATLAVATHLQTTPVLIVNWVNALRGVTETYCRRGLVNSWFGLRFSDSIQFDNSVCSKAFYQKRKGLEWQLIKANKNLSKGEVKLCLI